MRRLGHEALRSRRPRPRLGRRLPAGARPPRIGDEARGLDCIPIGEHLARADARFALAWWHWFFFGQTEKPAERVINADPRAWYENTAEHMGAEAYDDLWQALRDPLLYTA